MRLFYVMQVQQFPDFKYGNSPGIPAAFAEECKRTMLSIRCYFLIFRMAMRINTIPIQIGRKKINAPMMQAIKIPRIMISLASVQSFMIRQMHERDEGYWG